MFNAEGIRKILECAKRNLKGNSLTKSEENIHFMLKLTKLEVNIYFILKLGSL